MECGEKTGSMNTELIITEITHILIQMEMKCGIQLELQMISIMIPMLEQDPSQNQKIRQ